MQCTRIPHKHFNLPIHSLTHGASCLSIQQNESAWKTNENKRENGIVSMRSDTKGEFDGRRQWENLVVI